MNPADLIEQYTTERTESKLLEVRVVHFPGSFTASNAVTLIEDDGWDWWKAERHEDGTIRFWVRRKI